MNAVMMTRSCHGVVQLLERTINLIRVTPLQTVAIQQPHVHHTRVIEADEYDDDINNLIDSMQSKNPLLFKLNLS